MPEIRKSFPGAILLIAGHDPWGYSKDLQSLINILGLQQEVRLVGFLSDIPAFLGAVDVFAFATHSEGFGQVSSRQWQHRNPWSSARSHR